jgi:hypothetical protein
MKIKALNFQQNRWQRRKASTHRKTGPNDELARATENQRRTAEPELKINSS